MDGWITIGTKLETKQFDKQIEKLEREIADYENILKLAGKLELSSSDVEDLELKIEKAKNSIISLKKQQMQVNDIGFNKAGKELDKIGDKTGNIIKKVVRWALAVFSVRSAYMFVQRASSTLAQYDEQYAANLEYIRYALAQMIAPLLQYVVNLAYKLLTYINMIANAWFGVNLFANASTKAFEKANKSLGGSVAKAKELNKQLTGFDEMNILQKDGSVASGGGGGGVTMPGFDLSSMQGEVPSWLQWILDNGPIVKGIIGGIIGLFITSKFINVLNLIKTILTAKNLGILLGMITAFDGIKNLISDVNDNTVDAGNSFIDLAKLVGGVIIAVGLLTGSISTGLIGAIAGLLAFIVHSFATKGQEILEGFVKIWESAKEGFMKFIWTPIEEFFVGLWDWIKEVGNSFVKVWESAKEGFVKFVWNPIKDFFSNLTGWIKKIGDSFSAVWKSAKEGAKGAAKSIGNFFIDAINKFIGLLNSAIYKLNNISILGVSLKIPTISKLPRLKTGGIVNLPGRGVLTGGAITGEAGKEGVIPLTNSQAMQELGETIGRYITINANITNSMNGRVISRQVQKIMANQDFAYNS